MDRGRDRRFEDRDRPPPGRPPFRAPPGSSRPEYPRGDGFRSNRSPPPLKGRSPPLAEAYPVPEERAPRPRSRSPGGFRRRSQSPPAAQYRGRPRSPGPSGNWRTRERSPPRRWSPRRETGPREQRYVSPPAAPPAARGRYRSRSPARYPPTEYGRGREFAPAAVRSPPPSRMETFEPEPKDRYERPVAPPRRPYSPQQPVRQAPYADPRAGYRERSRSPHPRERRYAVHEVDQRRPRSPSPVARPARVDYRSDHSSGNTSRRSSPPVHPSRMSRGHPAAVDPRPLAPRASDDVRYAPRSAARSPPPRSPYRARSPLPMEPAPPRDREYPPPRRGYSPRPDSPPFRGAGGYRSPPRGRGYSPPREDEYYQEDERAAMDRNGYGSARPPRDFASPDIAPPAGPAADPMSMSAHNKPGIVSVLSAPRQPRGGFGPPPRRENSFTGPHGPGPRRGPPPSPYGPPGHGRGPPPRGPSFGGPGRSPPRPGSPGSGPGGPRSGFVPPPYRPSSNTTSRTYPLTQRFSRQLSDLPAIVPGGKLAPSGMDKQISERLTKLQQEQEKLQKELAEKEEKKRKGLRNWDRMERESSRDGLKSELAEQQVKMMAGEGGLGGAAF